MKNLFYFLILFAITTPPLRVNAMMEGREEKKAEEGPGGVDRTERNSSEAAEEAAQKQVTAKPSAHTLENEEPSAIEDSNTDSNIDELLGADIRRNIQTIETINVAGDLLDRQEEVKRSLKEQHPDIDLDSLEDLDSYIEKELLKKYKLGIVARLQDERERDLLSHGLEDEKEVAKSFTIRAKKLEIITQRLINEQRADEELQSSYYNTAAAWTETTIAYDLLLAKAEALQIATEPSLLTEKEYAEERSHFWSSKKSEFISEKKISIPKKKTFHRIQNEHRAARETIWARRNQPIYENYSLIEEIPGVTTFDGEHNLAPQDFQHSSQFIQPERLNEELETIGKRRMREGWPKRNEADKAIPSASAMSATATAAAIPTTPTLKLAAQPLYLEEEIKLAIMRESLNPTPLNQERWEARRLADEWIKKAAEVAKRFKDLKSQAEEIRATEEKEDMTATEQSTVWEKMTSALGWTPKISVVGSRKGSTVTSEHNPAKTSLPTNLVLPENPTQRDLDQFNNYADQAERAWEDLVKRAPSFPEKTELWFQSDWKALKRKMEQQLEDEREALARRLQETWEKETLRWKSWREADQKKKELQKLEHQLREKEEDKKNASSQLALKRFNMNQMGRTAEGTQELERLQQRVAAEEEALMELQSTIEPLRTQATEAKNHWIALAQEEKIFKRASDETARKDALELVEESDRATNEVWEKVKKLYQEQTMTNLPDFELAEEEGGKEEFKKRINSIPQNATYAIALKKEALKAAREKIPDAQETLLRNYLDKKGTRLEKAAASAFESFQKEEKRLLDIESLWMGVIEAKQRHLLAAREAAAVAYWNEDPTDWDQLPLRAKEEYNDQIAKLNDQAGNEERIKFATERAAQWREHLEKLQIRAWRTWKSEIVNAQKATEEAEKKLFLLKIEEREKKSVIAWGKKTEAELESELHALRERLQEIEQSKKEVAQKKEERDGDDGWSYALAGDSWIQAVSYLEHAAYELENRNYFYELWKEAAEMATKAAQLYEQSAERYASGIYSGKGGGFDLRRAAYSTLDSAKAKVEQVIPWKSQQKGALEQGRDEEAQLLEQAIHNAQEAAQLYEKSAQQYAAGNEDGKGGGDALGNTADSTLESAKAKAEAALWKSQQKAALESGQNEEAQLWGEAINKALEAAQLYERSAEQYATGNEKGKGEGDNLGVAAGHTLDSAKAKVEQIIPWKSQQKAALEQGRGEEAQLWEEAIHNAQEAALLYERSAQQYDAGEYGRGGGWLLSKTAEATLESAKAKVDLNSAVGGKKIRF